MRFARAAATLAMLALSSAVFADTDDQPAKKLFGAVSTPAPGTARPVGSYAAGCLAGAVPLPTDGAHWQVMRLMRNRNWGTPELVSYIETFANDAAKDGWNGILIGDMSQPRGGPMLTGHDSHQTGLDVDVWYLQMPQGGYSAAARETVGAPSVLIDGKLQVDPKEWTPQRVALLRRAASYPEVARIFVSAAIKKNLCDTVTGDRSWLRKIRPWYLHEDHFHVRLVCPPGLASCVNQAPVEPGDGCGADLAEWFKPPPPPQPPTLPYRLPPPVTLANLPSACTGVVTATPGGLTPAELKIEPPLPHLRPGS